MDIYRARVETGPSKVPPMVPRLPGFLGLEWMWGYDGNGSV